MAHDVAEAAALRAQHAQAPARLGGQVDEVGDGGLGRGRQAVLDVLVALAQDLQIQRELQRRAVGGLGAVDEAVDEVAVAHHVHLEPERVAARVLCNVLNGANAHGGQRERNAKRLGRLGAQDFAIGVLHAGQARRRNRHRHGHVLPHHGGAGGTAFHVHRHALAQLDALEVRLVGAVGALGVRARIGIVVEHARHAALGDDAQVFDTGDFGQVWHALAPFLKYSAAW